LRAIIRFSIDRETDGSLRNKLLGKLKKRGFKLQRQTATYEHANIDYVDLSQVLSDFWDTAELHHSQLGKPGRVDHFWMYCDRKPYFVARGAPTISK